jgi:uncharacterized repeat protein (TIGR03803 family)
MLRPALNTFPSSIDLSARTWRLLPWLCIGMVAMPTAQATEVASDEVLVEFSESTFAPCNLTVAGTDHVIGTTERRQRDFGELWEWREGSGFRILHDFDESVDPGMPRVAPTLADDGSWYMPIERHYYGVSTLGAPELYISRLRSDGVFETFIDDLKASYGIRYSSMLVQGADRRIYGFGRGFGSSQDLYAFSLSGIFSKLKNIVPDPQSQSPSGLTGCGLTRGPDHAMYGVTLYGGEYLGGALFRLLVTGEMQVVHSFPLPAQDVKGRVRSSVAVGTDGRLYGVVDKTIYSIRPDGTGYRSLVTIDDERLRPLTVKVGPHGDLYGGIKKLASASEEPELLYYRLTKDKKFTVSPVPGRGSLGVLEPTLSGLFIFQEMPKKKGGLLTRTPLP